MAEAVEAGDATALSVTRTIPVPVSVSPEAQRTLAGAAAAVAGAGLMTAPALDDAEGWRAFVQMVNAGLLSMFEAQTEQLDCAVETKAVAGIPVVDMTPAGLEHAESIHLDIHGGALVYGGGESCRVMGMHSAVRTRMHTWSVDYRMPPDHPYPAALDDCLAVYREVLKSWSPDRVAVSGASAGGNLAAALMLRAHDEGLPMPAALVLLSPEVDLTESGDSFRTNLGVDSVLTQSLGAQNALYAGGHDLAHPYLSPLFGDLSAFPPTFLQTGTRDLFLSNTVRMHRNLRAANIGADLHVFEAMPHGGFWGAPEDREVADEVRRFLDAHLAP